nr:methyltransferase domain-containing protein [Deltaproteobacteria bacterium]
MSRVGTDHPRVHYDNATQAWRLLMGRNFHYGCFASPDQPLDDATAALTERMVQHAELNADTTVIDVGCGIGGPAIHLARTVGCTVTGISTSEVGVTTGNALATSEGVADQVSLLVRDGMDNGLPDAAFDRAWVMESSHLMPDKPAMIAECARVLRPGGRLVLCD